MNVSKLECITMEQLSTWFADRNTKNARKKPILQEIFKVARMEEKYKRGEIGWLLSAHLYFLSRMC